MNELKILGMVQDTIVKPGGNVEAIRVTFNLGTYGPFTETFEKAGFTADQVKTKALALQAQINALTV